MDRIPGSRPPDRRFFVALAAEDARCQPQCIALSARFLGCYDELEAAGSSSSKNLVDDSLFIWVCLKLGYIPNEIAI